MGTKGIATAKKLRDLATAMQGQIDHKMSTDRLTNTRRRRQIAASLRSEGERLIRVQKALLRLADLHERDSVPEVLAGFKTKKAVYGAMLESRFDSDKPREETPESIALWGLIGRKTEEERLAEIRWKMEQEIKALRIPGFFQTPPDVLQKMLDIARIEKNDRVLEPSAGAGAIADALRGVCALDCCEISPTLQRYLDAKGHKVVEGDFFDLSKELSYERIVMNPPFEGLADAEHIRHAFGFLAPGGRLVSIMSPSAFHGSQRKAQEFRDWFAEKEGCMEKLPEGSFKESGTGVSTCIVWIDN